MSVGGRSLAVVKHIVWDWNGTLFDDQHVVVAALNDALAHTDIGPVTVQMYRDLYTRPIPEFYRRLLGREIPADEWVHIDDTFHAAYRRLLRDADPARDAEDALRQAHAAGWSQSLLSMWRHEELVRLVDELGLTRWLSRIDGVRDEGGGRKVDHLRAHLGTLDRDPAGSVVIGDAVDDAHAAIALGAGCVLYEGGSHHRRDLEATGAPVADDLLHALELAGVLQVDSTGSTAGPSAGSAS